MLIASPVCPPIIKKEIKLEKKEKEILGGYN
jgi:hypothetical protein